MKCVEIMTKDPVFCLPSDTVQKVARLMKDEDVGPIPVVDAETTRKLMGIVTDRDLAVRVVAEGRNPSTTTVQEVMTTSAISCIADDDVRKGLNAMAENQVRRIPVVDDNGRLVGIIAQADIATRIDEPEKTAELVQEISKVAGTGN